MKRLSIIVPLMGNLKRFEDTLVSVLENQPERSEVVVVLNEPYSDPYDLRGEVAFVDAPLGAGMADCFACGLAASSGAVVHMLAAGFEASAGWAEAALQRFQDPLVAAVVPLAVDREKPDRILSAGLSYGVSGSIRGVATGQRRERIAAYDLALCGPALAAAFYRRDVLETLGGLWDYGCERAAAVDLALALRGAGYHLVLEPACVVTATGDVLATRRSWREGVAGERLYLRWKAAGWKGSSVAHATLLAAECLQVPLRPSNLLRLAGRFWARLGGGVPRSVALGPQRAASPKETVIRPHFTAADALAALHSRAAG